MSTQEQARALMLRHQHMIRNREQCLLTRAAADVGMPAEVALRNIDQGKAHLMRSGYDRSNVALS